MPEKIFDRYAENYRELLKKSTWFLFKDDLFFDLLKLYRIKDQISDMETKRWSVLDYGCGIGKLSGLLAKHFKSSVVYGYDISEKSLAVARDENSDSRNLFFVNDISDPGKYDLVVAANVFHHIEKSRRKDTISEIGKILKPDGKLIVFELNPFNPLTRYVVKRCHFDADAELIHRRDLLRLAEENGFKVCACFYIGFFPWVSGIFKIIESAIKSLPLGAQYMAILSGINKDQPI